MRLAILAVGKLKAGPEAALVAHYSKQIRWAHSIHEIADAPDNLASEARLLREADAIRKKMPAGALLITLDARGKALTSEGFAQLLASTRDAGRGDVAFAIGGHDGLHPTLVKESTLSLSFSPMIWPHKLARVMLMEQIFRAQCILHNHPYHGGH